MNHKFPSTLAAAAVALASQSASAAPIPSFDPLGNLTGAAGVSVNGNLFDVQFVGNSCANLFGGCADGTSFVISPGDAYAAGQAILGLIGSNFSFLPAAGLPRISGCSTNSASRCDILTPFAVANGVVQVEDAGLRFNPQVGVSETLTSTTIGPNVMVSRIESTYAVWTREAVTASVPEPASAALVAIGLAAAATRLKKGRPGR